jgi:hypothetical protein
MAYLFFSTKFRVTLLKVANRRILMLKSAKDYIECWERVVSLQRLVLSCVFRLCLTI